MAMSIVSAGCDLRSLGSMSARSTGTHARVVGMLNGMESEPQRACVYVGRCCGVSCAALRGGARARMRLRNKRRASTRPAPGTSWVAWKARYRVCPCEICTAVRVQSCTGVTGFGSAKSCPLPAGRPRRRRVGRCHGVACARVFSAWFSEVPCPGKYSHRVGVPPQEPRERTVRAIPNGTAYRPGPARG
jgi:hypothetical protein